MTTIHMETEKVHALAKKLGTDGTQILANITSMQSSAASLRSTWQGGGADDFNADFGRLIKKIEGQIEDLQTLSMRLTREVDEWENVDQTGARQSKVVTSKLIKQDGTPRLIKDARVDKDTEYALLRGTESRAYAGHLKGDLSFEEAVEFIEKDPFKKDYVKSSITFYKAEQADKFAAVDGQYATKYGDFTGSLFSVERKGTAKIDFKEGALHADASADIAGYIAKGTYGAEVAGLSVAAVGFIGGEGQFGSGLAFDPSKGEVGGKVEVDAFVGGKLEGSVSKKGAVAGVEGEVTASGGLSYGLGATGKADVGFSKGHLRSEIELGATIGLGAEFSISVDINVQQAVTSTIDTAKKAVDWLF
jgi:WXG100 family type VII secretion target